MVLAGGGGTSFPSTFARSSFGVLRRRYVANVVGKSSTILKTPPPRTNLNDLESPAVVQFTRRGGHPLRVAFFGPSEFKRFKELNLVRLFLVSAF